MRQLRFHLVGRDPSSWRERGQPRNDRVQVPEVSRPACLLARRKRQKLFSRLLAERHRRSGPAAKLLELVLHIRLDVLSTLRERRKPEGPEVDPGEQIVAKAA